MVSYQPLHETFAAEASGVDFLNLKTEDVAEIKRGLAKVRHTSSVTLNGDAEDQINSMAFWCSGKPVLTIVVM